jgi:Rhodopirellula transposase DDE domain
MASMPTVTPSSSTSTPSFQADDQPVISVDTKKKELVGNFTNKGPEYRPEGEPRRTEVHDFENKDLGKVVPYGVYDLADNSGSVGVTSDTAEFAVNAIRSWFDKKGRALYPAASRLMITADCGGSNGARVRLWKRELQNLADQTGLTISASRPELPSGTRSSTAFSAILRKTGVPAP